MKPGKQSGILAVLVAVMFLLTQNGWAAEQAGGGDERQFNIYVNPLGLVIGAANLSFEHKVAPRITLGISGDYSKYTDGVATATGIGIGVNSVFFLTNDAYDINDSWFVSPFLSYATASNSTNQSTSGVYLGANIGYWWYFENGINLNFGLGVQWISIDLTSIGLASVSAVLPSGTFSIGYAF